MCQGSPKSEVLCHARTSGIVSGMAIAPQTRTLRDQLTELEKTLHEVTIHTTAPYRNAASYRGTVSEVGIDYVTVQSADGLTDCALFHIVSVTWNPPPRAIGAIGRGARQPDTYRESAHLPSWPAAARGSP